MSNCIQPPQLTEDELSSLIDNEADERLQAHIRDCAYCNARLEEAREIEWLLRTELYRGDCPLPYELRDYVMGQTAKADTAIRIKEHLDICVYCQRAVETIQSSDAAAPATIVPFQPIASNVFYPQFLPASRRAVRGKGSAQRVVAKAGTTTIRLMIAPLPGDKQTLNIQVSSPDVDWQGGMVTIYRNNKIEAACLINEYLVGDCEILLSPKAMNVYLVSRSEQIIVFQDLEI